MKRVALLLLIPSIAAANTLEVGSGKPFATPCAAIGSAQAGDTIAVDSSGSYDGDTCEWSTDGLTITGVGSGRAKIDLTGVTPAGEKGIFTIDAPNATIENFELSGAAITADEGNNGAGIRHAGLNLTVINCYIHDNQDGILGVPSTAGSGVVTIENSEFYANGAGDGYSHNMYLGDYGTVTVEGSYSHGAVVGHLLKSRGYVNNILYNRLTDEAGTTASYEIDLPNGGTSYVIGNFIEQSAASQNPNIVTTGEEGTTNPDQHFFFVNNTVVNDMTSGTFVNLAAGTTAMFENNIFHGAGTVASGSATETTDWTDAQGDPQLVDPSTYDYHLEPTSPCVNAGTLPGSGLDGQSLVPAEEYIDPLTLDTRTIAGSAIDIGADEVGGTSAGSGSGSGGDTGSGDTGSDTGSDGSGASGSSNSGCGCRAPGDPASALILALCCAPLLRRRRR